MHFGKAGQMLAGVLLEVFDDLWGPVNTPSRSLTKTQLREWWITLAAVPRFSVVFMIFEGCVCAKEQPVGNVFRPPLQGL